MRARILPRVLMVLTTKYLSKVILDKFEQSVSLNQENKILVSIVLLLQVLFYLIRQIKWHFGTRIKFEPTFDFV